MSLLNLETFAERSELLKATVQSFAERAEKHDKEGSFPFKNFNDLKGIGYPALTVPKKYGGLGIFLYEMIRHQEMIAKADGSTALSIGWHMGITKHLGESQTWKDEKYQVFATDVVENSALLNNAATEPATGSPTRGGKPETVSKQTIDGWVITGRKTFTTMAPILDYFVVSASIDKTDKVGSFLIKRSREGVKVEETWDSIAMKATGSHDLVLEEVYVDEDDLVEYLTPGQKPAAGWLLHIPACYLGIAQAAQANAIEFAMSYSPSSMKGTISEIAAVKQKIGEMELRVMESQHFLYSVAKEWDESDDDIRQSMKPKLGAAKLSVVNKSLEVVDIAMRIVGARSLSQTNPLQRYYRDVRAGLHNPPMDDMTILQLAADSMNRIES